MNRSCPSLKKIDPEQIDLSITKNDWFDWKTDDQITNPDHSTSWQGWEFDLSIFNLSIFLIFKKDRPRSNRSLRSFKLNWPCSNRSHQSFKKIEHERINLIKRLDLCLWPINLLIAKNYQFDRKTWWLNSQPWCFNVVPCVCNLFIWTNHCSNILSPLISFFKLNIGMKEAKTWPDRKRDFSFTNTSYLSFWYWKDSERKKQQIFSPTGYSKVSK